MITAEQNEAGQAPPFHIPATASFPDRQARSLKHGDTFAVFDSRGDIGGGSENPEGIYHFDTRILSHLELGLNGSRLLLLSSTIQDDNSVFSADLANPDLMVDGQIVLKHELIHIHRMKFVWDGACYERLLVQNYDDAPHALQLAFRFEADYADLFEVRGQSRPAHGRRSAERRSEREVLLHYVALDGVGQSTALAFDPPPDSLDTVSAQYEFTLAPGEKRRLFLRVGWSAAESGTWQARHFYRKKRLALQSLRTSSKRAVAIEGSNSLFNEMARRSIADLYMLITDTEQGPYPYAGIPWYSTVFGRDGLITALLTLWLDPEIAKGALKFLAATQATDSDPARDAQPGKILHEMRRGEMARLREVPFARYYGTVDATPLFVYLSGEYFRQTGDIETIRGLWPHIQAALRWIDTYGDLDGDGFVEYYRESDKGLVNQGWKDSGDAIFHRDGRLAEGPIALCEVQSYVYGAKRHAGLMARAMGLPELSENYAHQAKTLKRRFEDAFWCDELSTYAMALDGRKEPCRVISSNAGHALLTGLAAPDRAEKVARTLLGPRCFSGWGIRTVAISEARYNPMSYHNGSVWPHDNALIALGLSRYGLRQEVLEVFHGLFDAAAYMNLRRLPELFCGFPRRRRNAPTLYPVACSPQAWASVTLIGLLQACLGLELRHDRNEIRFNRPCLPPFLEELQLRHLHMDGSSANVRLHRHGSEVAVTVSQREGSARVMVTQ